MATGDLNRLAGVLGLGQQTPAVQAMLPGRVRKKRSPRKKRAKKKATPRGRRTAAKKKPARLVKGSAAAKRHMAKLRKMQKRR
jgi:hypothetical protein